MRSLLQKFVVHGSLHLLEIKRVTYLIDIVGRIRDISNRKILDSATRKRRQKRQLEALEKDNFQDDPHSHLTVVPAKMKVPAFNDTMEGNITRIWLQQYYICYEHIMNTSLPYNRQFLYQDRSPTDSALMPYLEPQFWLVKSYLADKRRKRKSKTGELFKQVRHYVEW